MEACGQATRIDQVSFTGILGTMPPKKPPVPELTPDQLSQAEAVIRNAVTNFRGTVDELESAIGMYMLGHHLGWKVLVLVHSKRTIRKYEEILGIVVREEFPEEGSQSDRSIAYAAAKEVSNFWKAVSGEAKVFEPSDRKLLN